MTVDSNINLHINTKKAILCSFVYPNQDATADTGLCRDADTTISDPLLLGQPEFHLIHFIFHYAIYILKCKISDVEFSFISDF